MQPDAKVESAETTSLRPWAKPTIRSLVAGWFGDEPHQGVDRGNYHEGCRGLLTYNPTVHCDYQNPPS